jgi:hypothetical protein
VLCFAGTAPEKVSVAPALENLLLKWRSILRRSVTAGSGCSNSCPIKKRQGKDIFTALLCFPGNQTSGVET